MASVQSVFVAIFLVSAVVVAVRGGSVSGDEVELAIGCFQFESDPGLVLQDCCTCSKVNPLPRLSKEVRF
ncbi:hypothetical protein K227x_54850 [Rubripirellula lacrimiformis]|uniref:Uncharacterized protein n=1 Tax=Rubripirellula lacrimiformis TaxID=1930273 RepID=A0A517NIU4_9BACT|nr:hypothetical protein K227x_54850 [Rubripirellula lacrimiformis]